MAPDGIREREARPRTVFDAEGRGDVLPATMNARPYVVVTGDFTTLGGMDRANYAVARHLARTGHETHLVAFRVAPELASEPNVHAHVVPRPRGRHLLGAPLLGSRGILEALRRRREGAEVIVNGGNCFAPDAVNWVHYVHAAAGSSRGRSARPQAWLARATERVGIRGARLVLANSQRTRDDLVKHLGIDPARIRVVYLGVDADEFRPRTDAERAEARAALGWKDGRRKVVFVGALSDERKGFGTLFGAWKALCASKDWDCDLVVVGAGGDLDAWRERARDAGLAGRIDLLGFRRDVAKIVAASDLLVAPSRYEPYGLAVHEALCSGVPAMTAATSGVAERYPEELRGWVLPDPDDDVDLARRLTAWRGEAREARSAALAALSARLRARTWEAVAKDIVAVCEGQAVSTL
jgi:glycosyltransferase involved in cell wall biosynthesis